MSPQTKFSADRTARRKYEGLLRESFLQMASITSKFPATVMGDNTARIIDVVIVAE